MRNMRVFVDRIDPSRIERTRSSNNAIDLIALSEKKFGQLRSVLPCNATDQRFFYKHTPSLRRNNMDGLCLDYATLSTAHF